MSSKISKDQLYDVVNSVLNGVKEKPRKFKETIELQIALKNYDPQKDKRFSGTVRLKSIPKPRFKLVSMRETHCCPIERPNLTTLCLITAGCAFWATSSTAMRQPPTTSRSWTRKLSRS